MGRARNATRNIAFGAVQRIYQMLIPFVIRTLMIYILGIEYSGLNSLFTSVLQVLNMAEMGIGSAMVYSMYKPVSEGDTEKVCALMRLYKIYYRIIGLVVFIGGLLIMPALPYLIKSDLPADVNLYVLYFLNLLSTVTTYWLLAYKQSILYAHQRADVGTKVALLTETGKYILQILAIVVFKNYYLYTIVFIITQVATNIITAVCAQKMFPQYKTGGTLPKKEIKSINQRIRDLFTSKVGVVVFNSVDTITISAFLGLRILAVYQNYYFIVTSLTSIVAIIFTSCLASIGNSIIVETKEKVFNDFKKYTLIITWVVGFCTVGMLCLSQPFMLVWQTESNMLPFMYVIFFCVFFFVNQISAMVESYKDAAGIWHEDRFRPLVLALINLILNLILIQIIGLIGVLIASCITKGVVGIPWVLRNLFNNVFKKQLFGYVKYLLKLVAVVVLAAVICYLICALLPFSGIAAIIVNLVICVVVANVFFILCWRKMPEYTEVMRMLRSLLPRRLHGIINLLSK